MSDSVQYILTSKGRRLLSSLQRRVFYDFEGRMRISGTEEEATSKTVLELIEEGPIALGNWMSTPDVGPVIRRGLGGLFEGGYIERIEA